MKNRLTKVNQNNLKRRKRKTKKQASNNNSVCESDLGLYNLTITQKIAVFGFVLAAALSILFFNPDARQAPLLSASAEPIKAFWNLNTPLAKAYERPTPKCLSIDVNRVNKYNKFHKTIFTIVKDTNMEVMADEISKKKPSVAGFLIGIAMKESKFGTYAPKKNGRDCFNYWGYRGSENTTASGYSCFDTPEQAVSIVGRRIESLVAQGANSPASMISWKCGSSCAGHSPDSVSKWIADVGIYYYQINNKVELAKLL